MRSRSARVTACSFPLCVGVGTRIAGPSQAATLLSALGERDRALWAAAFYTGSAAASCVGCGGRTSISRRGPSRCAEHGPCRRRGSPKSAAGTRTVPIIPRLREHLVAQRLRTGGRGPVFPSTTGRPFDPESVQARADRAWAAGGLTRITQHECRHTFASLMIAAGVNVKALSTLLGHASITVTLDRYGHLLPGSEQEARRPPGRLPRAGLGGGALRSRSRAGRPWGSDGEAAHRSERSRAATNRSSAAAGSPRRSAAVAADSAERSGAGIEPTHRRATPADRF